MNFKEHIAFGIITGIVFSIIFLFYEGTSYLFMFPLFLAIFGSVLPDIDHHKSTPFKTLKILVFLLSFFGSFAFIISHTEIKFMTILITISAAIVSGILAVIILKTLKPAHRGITHKKTFGISIGFLLFLFFYLTFHQINFSIISAISFITGFFSHLALDKILFKI